MAAEAYVGDDWPPKGPLPEGDKEDNSMLPGIITKAHHDGRYTTLTLWVKVTSHMISCLSMSQRRGKGCKLHIVASIATEKRHRTHHCSLKL